MKCYQAVATALTDDDVEVLFGLVGDGNMFLVDSFASEHKRPYVAAANEAGAVLMAAGYASASGRVGVATVTHGPGLANTIQALVSATRDRAPLLLIAGDTRADSRGHTQKIDQRSLIAPTGAAFIQARSAASVANEVSRGLEQARRECRPVVLNVPVDFAWVEVEYERDRPAAPLAQDVAPGANVMDIAVGIIANARRPIVIGGAGARHRDAATALRALADLLGAPLATTLAAKGLFGADGNDLGVFGTLSSPQAMEAIAASDCLIFAGASLHEHTGGGDDYPYLRGKKVVQCDVDATVLGRCREVDALVLADARVFAETVVEWLNAADHTPSTFRDTISRSIGAEYRVAPAATDTLTLTHVLTSLEDALPADRSIAVDGGRFAIEAIQRLHVASPRSWSFSARGFGAVGNGIATAIGLGVALPEVPIVAIVGDGGFMLGGLAEFNTAVRYDIDLIVVVCNDGAYGAEFRKLRRRDLSGDVSKVAWPDFAPIADALGGRGYTVRTMHDLSGIRHEIEERDRPLLIDVKLDPTRGSD